ncbi:MAG: hypothetical protein ACF788_04295, partial [Novipirellula sp. JB048]
VHTEVQTGNFEVREISRYQVALKVSRTSQGVPMLQDIPLVGRAFRPAPSAESSLQQNIIFGQTNLYPTLYDLMGLRWAQQVVDLNHTDLLESEHVIRGRQKSMKDYVFGVASKRVDEFLDVQSKAPNSYRTDFYHEQSVSSPYHPNGYRHPMGVVDPTGNNYERHDRRPPEMQDPPYDRYRHQPVSPERIAPEIAPQLIQPLGMQQPDRPRNESRFDDYFESTSMQHQLPEVELREFKTLLAQEPRGMGGSRTPTQLNRGTTEAGRQARLAPESGRSLRSQEGAVQQFDVSSGVKPVQSMPSLRRVPAAHRRSPAMAPGSTVSPVGFERFESTRREVIIQNLPPVEFHLSD